MLFRTPYSIKVWAAAIISSEGSSSETVVKYRENIKCLALSLLRLTSPVTNHTDSNTFVVVPRCMSSDYVESSPFVNSSIATDGESVSDVIPSSILLVKLLHTQHSIAALCTGQTGARFVRMVNDHERNRSGEFVHTFWRLGIPCFSRHVRHCWNKRSGFRSCSRSLCNSAELYVRNVYVLAGI